MLFSRPLLRQGGQLRHINRAGRFALQQRIFKRDDLRGGAGENDSEHCQKIVIRRIVGPQREDTALVQMRRQRAQSIGRIKCAVARMQQIARGMVDIQQDRVKKSRGSVGIEAGFLSREREKIPMHEVAARIAG